MPSGAPGEFADTAESPYALPEPSGWRRRWLRVGLWAAALLALGAAGWWWRTASARVEREAADGLAFLRLGEYGEAWQRLEPIRQQWLVGRRVRGALEQARLGTALEEPVPDLDRFEQRLKAMQKRSPDDADVLLLAGDLARRRPGGTRAAIEAYERAAQLAPDLVEAYFHWAAVLMAEGEFDAAINALTQGLAASPEAPLLLNVRAYARRRLGDLDGAEADYRLSADQGLVRSRVELATEVLWRLGKFAAAANEQRLALDELQRGAAGMSRGRNALPWRFEMGPGTTLTLREVSAKTEYTRLCLQATQASLGEEEETDTNDEEARPAAVVEVVAAALQRVESRLPEPARSRARAFREKLRGDGGGERER